MSRAEIFAAVRSTVPGVFDDPGNVLALDNLLDAFGVPREDEARRISDDGVALIQRFEGCELTAYPDPGSADGNPWTIGWGSTGPDIKRGTVWTQDQCDERFRADLVQYEQQVEDALDGAPTTQSQFDALVSFHYNTGALPRSTLLKKHKAGDYAGAANEYGRWIYNAGKVMRGLVNRRAAEAELYST